MRIYFISLVLMLSTLNCISQKSLLRVFSDSKNNNKRQFSYIDSSSRFYYNWETYGGMVLKVLFTKGSFNKETRQLKVEGIATAEVTSSDTLGICCIDYFIAQPVNGYLTKIKNLGKTNDQSKNITKPEGYFSFEIILNKEDKLYFMNEKGGGLQEFNIGKVCFENMITKSKREYGSDKVSK